MLLHVAGGVGEHGRNCFAVLGKNVHFLVDCGIMQDEVPKLTKDEISILDFVLLTHSHGDHTGALGWLHEQGYKGPVIASRKTLEQIDPLDNAIALEDVCPDGHGMFHDVDISWGRSGHCEGAVHYLVQAEGKRICFSGDYCEDSIVYQCDPIRDMHADLAIIDCAYGNRAYDAMKTQKKLVKLVQGWYEKGETVLFPVPKYGRGMDLIRMMEEAGIPVYADKIQRHGIKEADAFWCKALPPYVPEKSKAFSDHGVLFLSDPQMKKEKTQLYARSVNHVVLTGTPEEGGTAYTLWKDKKAELVFWPVHQNLKQYRKLCSLNHFAKAVPYHSKSFKIENDMIEF